MTTTQTQIDDGGPAFPGGSIALSENEHPPMNGGMSLRDYLAAKAMQGWLAARDIPGKSTPFSPKNVAQAAYEFADAMLAARKAVDHV